ncbi:hypothetical protein GYMLUDRAFT_69572 [Collybiopsis luxurians FD-317 M1]|nr:hypothetical protein GYMLUDRAFT_69572 [Collybiopsis luxurians FD-317 M1]
MGSGKKKFYTVTVGKDVGVFRLWTQVSGVVLDHHCESFDSKEEAISAFDEAYNNGLVRITDSVVATYKSPRLHPPITSPPLPRRSALPANAPPPPTHVPPSPAPTPPTSPRSVRSLQASDFDNQSFGVVPGYPISPSPLNVTMRSPKRERNGSGRSTRNRADEAGRPQGKNIVASPVKREERIIASAPPIQPAVPRGERPLNNDSTENSTESEPECVSLTPRRTRTMPSLPGTPRPVASAVTRTKSAPASQIFSPSSSTSFSRYRECSPRQNQQIAIDLSDEDSYPEAPETESESDSSGPEDVTPPAAIGLLLSPLTSPRLTSPELMRTSAVANNRAMGTPVAVQRPLTIQNTPVGSSSRVMASPSSSSRPFSSNHEAAALGMSQPAHVPYTVYDTENDPRSPFRKGSFVPGEPK